MRIERSPFYPPEEIFRAVEEKVRLARKAGEAIDFLTFVPDGEPTLDANLGREIELLRPLGIAIAVICNAALIWCEDVRRDLALANWVSLKVDSVRSEVWRKIDRPHGRLGLDSILEGVRAFSAEYSGTLVTETMLVRGVNDDPAGLHELARFLHGVRPQTAYLAIPTRPPAEAWARAPAESTINQAFQILDARVDHVEYLVGYEGNAFAFTGDVEEDLLSITAVHPMRSDAVEAFVARAGANWAAVEHLVDSGRLARAEYDGQVFFVRKLTQRARCR
jgi:wyosine [tRNA(Phe)-imidazoG37] synthetase (radical SAM superfamily)